MAEAVIRKMKSEDVSSVVEIEHVSFSAPWAAETYRQEVEKNKYAHYFVIEVDKVLIGFVGIWLVRDEAQITNIAIHPNYRGYKLGEKLFGFAVQYVINHGATRLSLEVRKSNIVAQKLYEKFGLVAGGIRKGYYPDNGEDAIVMWVDLS